MSETVKSSRYRPSPLAFYGLLLAVLIGLKLTKVIQWSWWWVFAPLWIIIVFALIMLFGFWIVR